MDAGAQRGVDRAVHYPELGSVPWRARTSERSLRRRGRLWTLTTVAHTLPFIGGAALLFVASPITIPIGVIVLAHAWAIPELYAARGAGVLRRRKAADRDSEQRALLLLGDLIDQLLARLHATSGLVLERGRLGVWLVGEAGAVLLARAAIESTATA